MSSLQDIYVKLEGIDGESQDAKHKKWVDVNSFSYTVAQSSSQSSGGGAGVGKAAFSSLEFTHYVDVASPNLFLYCASGKHIGTVEISANKVGDGAQEYMHITMSDVIVVHVGLQGATGDARSVETVSLSYAKIKIEVKEQNPDGSMGRTVTVGWDVKENKAI